jgi:hypothetical protein
MFERDKTARDYKFDQRKAEDEQIRKQQEEDRKMAYIDSLGRINRDDPSAAITSLAKLGIIDDNADPDKYYNAVFPHMQRNSTNLGDRMLMESFDPGTGRVVGQEYGVGLSPDVARQTQANERVANVNAFAHKYVADRQAEQAKAAKMFQDENGQFHWGDPYSRTTTPTGVTGALPKNSQQLTPNELVKNLTAYREQNLDVLGNILPGREDVVKQIDAQIEAILKLNSGAVGQQQPGAAPPPVLPQQPQGYALPQFSPLDHEMAGGSVPPPGAGQLGQTNASVDPILKALMALHWSEE